jgi:hypothetical protein
MLLVSGITTLHECEPPAGHTEQKQSPHLLRVEVQKNSIKQTKNPMLGKAFCDLPVKIKARIQENKILEYKIL